MPNTILNPTIIAQTAVRILENELVMARRVYRGYEDEFDKKVNGYMIGDTVSIRKPQQFSVRSTAVAVIQDIAEGKLTLTVNLQKGIDFKFSGAELTLKIDQLADRIIKPAMVRLANQVDIDVMNLYTQIPNWVGEPVTGADSPVNSFAEFAVAAERLDQFAVPQDDRSAVLSPESYWGLGTGTMSLFAPQITTDAYRRGEIGQIGGISTYMSQNVPTYIGGGNNDSAATVAAAGGAGVLSTTWAAVLNTEAMPGTMSMNIAAVVPATSVIKAGTVFTIGSTTGAVRAVNPVTKAILPFQQQFTVVQDSAAAVGGAVTIVITPPIIPITVDAAFGTTDIAPIAGALLNIVGDSAGSYRQNMVFHRNAFALVMVPMIKPPGAVDVARETYKGTSVRLIPYYDGTNDVSNYRLDVLYGVKVVDNRMAVRLTGGASTVGNPSL